MFNIIYILTSFEILLFFLAIGATSTAEHNMRLRITYIFSDCALIVLCVPLVTKQCCAQARRWHLRRPWTQIAISVGLGEVWTHPFVHLECAEGLSRATENKAKRCQISARKREGDLVLVWAGHFSSSILCSLTYLLFERLQNLPATTNSTVSVSDSESFGSTTSQTQNCFHCFVIFQSLPSRC